METMQLYKYFSKGVSFSQFSLCIFGKKRDKMIQRIQSIYLVIAAIGALLSAFLFPMWTAEGFDYFASSDLVLFGLILAIALISLIGIFLFKKRRLQMKMCSLISLLSVVCGVYVGYQYYNYDVESTLGIGAFFLIFPLFSSIMAKKAIKKDDDLIRSVDRIR